MQILFGNPSRSQYLDYATDPRCNWDLVRHLKTSVWKSKSECAWKFNFVTVLKHLNRSQQNYRLCEQSEKLFLDIQLETSSSSTWNSKLFTFMEYRNRKKKVSIWKIIFICQSKRNQQNHTDTDKKCMRIY